MTDHIKQLQKLHRELFIVGGSISDSQWKAILIRSLKFSWQMYEPMLNVHKNPDEIINFLLMQEQHNVTNASSTTGERALNASMSISTSACPKCKNCHH